MAIQADEARLTDVEVKLAFQDDLLEALNRVVAEQQRQIDLLQGEMQLLYGQLKSLQSGMSDQPVEDSPPPHY